MDVEKTFAALTEDSGLQSIKAASVERYVFSPITFWCEVHAPEEAMDGPDPYQRHLFAVGQTHQSAVIDESYAGAIQEIFFEEEDGFRRTLELMAQGERYIKNMPLMCRPLGIEGRPDLLIRVDGVPSGLGPHSYAVVEIKSARNIQKAHVLQGAVYNRLIGKVQGYEPPEFYVINRDGELSTNGMGEVNSDLDKALDDMRRVIAGEPVEPCHGAGLWPWKGYVNQLAMERNDVSLIPGVGTAKRRDLINAGFRTVDAVAAADEPSLVSVRGVGASTARKLVTSAMAIERYRPVRREQMTRIPRAKTEVFLDLEGTDPRIGSEGLDVVNYLIGAVVRTPARPATFIPFFASAPDEEERTLRAFFKWSATLEDAIFYHWHHYERTHLTRMADHYGLVQRLVSPVFDRLVDLHPITTRAFAFPTYNEGLKDIARSLGFSWRQEDVDALASVVLYLRYVRSRATDEEAREKILDYNEDDCRAMMHVFDWLVTQQP